MRIALIFFKLMPRELAPVVDFQSRDAGAAELAAGSGAAHIHIVHIAAGGEIGHMSLAWSALPVPRGQRLGCGSGRRTNFNLARTGCVRRARGAALKGQHRRASRLDHPSA